MSKVLLVSLFFFVGSSSWACAKRCFYPGRPWSDCAEEPRVTESPGVMTPSKVIRNRLVASRKRYSKSNGRWNRFSLVVIFFADCHSPFQRRLLRPGFSRVRCLLFVKAERSM